MSNNQYVVQDHPGNAELGIKAGDIMQEYTGCDYGMVRDHETITGVAHINLSYDGDIPFYCVPCSAVKDYFA